MAIDQLSGELVYFVGLLESIAVDCHTQQTHTHTPSRSHIKVKGPERTLNHPGVCTLMFLPKWHDRGVQQVLQCRAERGTAMPEQASVLSQLRYFRAF